MVLRYPVECLTCHALYTLRISVGHRDYQEHRINCKECGEEIRVCLKVDFDKITAEPVCVLNCAPSRPGGLVVNLYPEHPIGQDEIHMDSLIPGLMATQKLYQKLTEQGEAILKKPSRSRDILIADPSAAWKLIRKSWQLLQKGKVELANESIEELRVRSEAIAKCKANVPEVLNCFFQSFLGKKIELMRNAGHVIQYCQRHHPSKYFKFLDCFYNQLWPSHQDGFIDAANEYFAVFSELNQVLRCCQLDLPLDPDAAVTSSAFHTTKMLYGNLFEILTQQFVVLACLNNVASGRKFDEFKQLTLQKYLKLDKANRANPFLINPQLASFAEGLNSQLRNASHHRAMEITEGGIVQYRSGGSGALQELSYAEYLFSCNQIFLTLCALMYLQLLLSYQFASLKKPPPQ